MYIPTQALKKILNLKKRLKIVQGGSSAGKTIAILLILIDIAQSQKDKIISVVSESLPHLRRGAIRDFLSIMETHRYYKDDRWNKSEFTYNFETGSKIEFFSADQPDKVRGPRRDILFINEANNLSYDTYTQLAIRTNEIIYLDYNPVQSFWVHEDLLPKKEGDFLVLTYKDNEALPEAIIQEIESRKANQNWYKVYGLGELGDIESRIYQGWRVIDEVPFEARLERYGLDWGYTNDPTAVIAIYYHNGGWVFDEAVYKKGMSNKDIADTFKAIPERLIVADSAEPKSIDELRSYGLNVMPAEKGKDSVRNGIQAIQGQPISITKRSVNLIKEYRNYLWKTDKNGKIINEPEDINDHLMDALRYAMSSIGKLKPVTNPWDVYWTEEELNPQSKVKSVNRGI